MLVLSRAVGERIRIGDDVTLVIQKVRGNRVSIGFEAPDQVRITRAELLFDDSVDHPAARDEAENCPAAMCCR